MSHDSCVAKLVNILGTRRLVSFHLMSLPSGTTATHWWKEPCEYFSSITIRITLKISITLTHWWKELCWLFFINNNKNNTNNGNNRNTLMKRTLWVSSWITIMDLPCPSSHHVSNSQDLRHHICKFAKLPIFACSCPSQCLLNCFLPLGFLNQLIQAVPDFTHICVYDTSVIVSTNSVTCKHLY